MTIHSPEPWKLEEEGGRQVNLVAADGFEVCSVNIEGDWVPPELERANITRISACVSALRGRRPELLSPLLALAGYTAGLLRATADSYGRQDLRDASDQLMKAINLFNNAVPQPKGEDHGDGTQIQAHADDGRRS